MQPERLGYLGSSNIAVISEARHTSILLYHTHFYPIKGYAIYDLPNFEPAKMKPSEILNQDVVAGKILSLLWS